MPHNNAIFDAENHQSIKPMSVGNQKRDLPLTDFSGHLALIMITIKDEFSMLTVFNYDQNKYTKEGIISLKRSEAKLVILFVVVVMLDCLKSPSTLRQAAIRAAEILRERMQPIREKFPDADWKTLCQTCASSKIDMCVRSL